MVLKIPYNYVYYQIFGKRKKGGKRDLFFWGVKKKISFQRIKKVDIKNAGWIIYVWNTISDGSK